MLMMMITIRLHSQSHIAIRIVIVTEIVSHQAVLYE